MCDYEYKNDGDYDTVELGKVPPPIAATVSFLVIRRTGPLWARLHCAVEDYTRKLKLERREMEEEIEVLERLLSGDLRSDLEQENEQQSVDEVLGLDVQQSDLIAGAEDLSVT